MKISGKTELLSVIGKPIKHSLSPKLHNFLSEEMNLDYVYVAFEPENIPDAFNAIKALNIKGTNITAPYKYEALKYADVLSDNARFSGSVNTIVNDNGKLIGYSTDGEGLYRSLKAEGIDVCDKKILVLGAGGASKPICVMLKVRGAKSVTVKNRTVSKAEKLCDDLNNDMNTDIFEVHTDFNEYDIIINTTSAGMGNEELPSDFDCSLFDKAKVAVDIIYYPRKTAFLKGAEEKGLKIINGLGMLAYQGIIAYEHFTGCVIPEDICRRAVNIIDE